MNIFVRSYADADYPAIKALYQDSALYGGQFDEARDARELLAKKVAAGPDAILVAEINGILVGTISIIDDGRVAMLFRFAVQKGSMETEVAHILYKAASAVLHARGHTQILVYTPVHNEHLRERYNRLGMQQGNDYTCYWSTI